MYLLDDVKIGLANYKRSCSHVNTHYECNAFLNYGTWQRVFLEYWYRSCWAFRGWEKPKEWVGMETLNAHTWDDAKPDDASFRFHFFFIFYSRWTNPFLHSICIRARWLFFLGTTRFQRFDTLVRVIWQSLFAFMQSTFIFVLFFPPFCFLINWKALKVSALCFSFSPCSSLSWESRSC